MATRVAQSRFPLAGWWLAAVAWPLLLWFWVRQQEVVLGREELVFYGLAEAAFVAAALYATFERWRFPDSTLVVDAPPVPGHDFRARIETPLRDDPPGGIRVEILALDPLKPTGTPIWRAETAAHLLRGERGVVAHVDVRVPPRLADDPRRPQWRLSARAGLYRAHFRFSEAPAADARTPP